MPMNIAYRFFSARLNALLEREIWAREALIPHIGATARLSITPLACALSVQNDGRVALASADEHAISPTVSMTVPADALPALINGGAKAVMKQARIEGDAEFAATLAKLAEHLRPDLEEALARWIGDAPAHCIGQGAHRLRLYTWNTAQALLQSGAEYVLEEKPRWLGVAAFAQFESEVIQLRDAAERLEKRMARLERTGANP